MEHLEAAKQSAKESAEKAAVETAAVETAAAAAAAAQLSPSRAAAAPPAGPALEPPTPEQSRETRILLQALEALEQRADANAASVAAPPSRRDDIWTRVISATPSKAAAEAAAKAAAEASAGLDKVRTRR